MNAKLKAAQPEAVQKALYRLGAAEWRAFIKAWQQSESMREVAKVMGVSEADGAGRVVAVTTLLSGPALPQSSCARSAT